MQTSLKRQETNQPPPIKTGYGFTSDPILTLEIETVFDTAANVGVDFVGLIVDTVNVRQTLVWTDGINWYSDLFGGCCDYSWPSWYVVDSSGQYPNSYPSIQDVLDDTSGTVYIRLLTTSSGGVAFSDRAVTIHGNVEGRNALGYQFILGNIVVTSTAPGNTLQLSNIRTAGHAIQLTGSNGISFYANHCHFSAGDSGGIAVNGCIYNGTATGLIFMQDCTISGNTNILPGLYCSGSLTIRNSQCRFGLNGAATAFYVNTTTFELSNSHFEAVRTGGGTAMLLQLAPAAASKIERCSFYTNAGAVSIGCTAGWNPARFYFNQANVAWAAGLVPVGTAFNTVG